MAPIRREDVVASIKDEPADTNPKKDRAIDDALRITLDLDRREREQVLHHRETFASNAYGYTQAWIGFLIVVTIAQMIFKGLGFGLGEAEFITVFTTTTAAVFGFALLVGNFLFPKDGSRRGARTSDEKEK
ncbi:hypothetical protein [Devosia riboflavina]